MESSKDLLRSGDKNSDQLHLYLTSEMYDCTFKVGCQESGYKIYKCHKLILSIASTVFQTMFYGHFQESKKGPDDPVLLENVQPEAFNAVMRYIYGSEKEFQEAALAIEVYKFAHEMQLDNLLSDVGKVLYDVGPDDLISVYNLFAFTENEQGLEHCRRKISQNTHAVLDSQCWLSATEETMKDILIIEDLYISESNLFNAVIRWGEAQFDEICSDDQLREQVDSCIKLIRFMSMNIKEFADLCTSTNVLSIEEKYEIFLAIVKNDSDYMPEKFSRETVSRENNELVIKVKTTAPQNSARSFKPSFDTVPGISMWSTRNGRQSQVHNGGWLKGLQASHQMFKKDSSFKVPNSARRPI